MHLSASGFELGALNFYNIWNEKDNKSTNIRISRKPKENFRTILSVFWNEEAPFVADAHASFRASITSTRAVDASRTANDAISISCVTGGKTYTKVNYVTANADGVFTVANPGGVHWYDSNGNEL